MENTLQDLDHQIQIVNMQIAYETDNDAKQKLNLKIQSLRLKKEIAEIRKKIEALG
jgi:hypothetical protein